MGFFSGIANFGSKILGGVKKAAQWIAPAMHKVLSTISGPVGMIHPGIGGALGAGANLAVRQLITNDIAYYIQYSKRGGSSRGMMQNDEYQLFIDNNNALVYAANNQIVDGMASDYALKIEPNGLLTIKNLKVINFDFVAQINQLINQVNLLQQSIGTTEQDITDIKNDIDTINQELSRQTHFRGYYLLNTDIQNLPNSANGDFAFSAESGTVLMFDAAWYNSGDIVPDQVTPASDALPIVDGSANAGISTEYSRGDHVHPLNITSTIPISDSASGSVGTANYYARSDHSHPINITTTLPPQDSASGSVGTTNYYARNDHSHPINVETNASNIPIVNGVGANGTSAFYARQDHVHPQQLTYDGNVTATKFIKTGGTNQQILMADGTTKQITDFNSSVVQKDGQILPNRVYWQCLAVLTLPDYTNVQTNGYTAIQNKFINNGGIINGNMQINPTLGYGYDDGLRIARTIANTGSASIELGCSKTSTNGTIQGQWAIYTPSINIAQAPQSFIIAVASQAAEDVTRGLQISADGNTLTFNGRTL
ncbi:MAG: hypothetical protein EZS28_034810 [Streblomastix strix]|uniref:Uncharacterized protein n=1 Tax=Streblomastix strix TaxID=222440 RepID=A0A5J4UHK7_9EUKA|nr:MAG: hypothetical protein EZS28_034810 [Streblomastix strix]